MIAAETLELFTVGKPWPATVATISRDDASGPCEGEITVYDYDLDRAIFRISMEEGEDVLPVRISGNYLVIGGRPHRLPSDSPRRARSSKRRRRW